MREYLERIFPYLANEYNEATEEKTWYLYDIMNFFEFCVFFVARTILSTFLAACGVIVKFGIILLLTYAFAFCIFYYCDHYLLDEKKRTTEPPNLKRPSEFAGWQNSNEKTYPFTINYARKSDENNIGSENKETNKRTASMDSDMSEEVVRVGSFKRPGESNGQKSQIGKALQDLANIETKTYTQDTKSNVVSIAKSEIDAKTSTA